MSNTVVPRRALTNAFIVHTVTNACNAEWNKGVAGHEHRPCGEVREAPRARHNFNVAIGYGEPALHKPPSGISTRAMGIAHQQRDEQPKEQNTRLVGGEEEGAFLIKCPPVS